MGMRNKEQFMERFHKAWSFSNPSPPPEAWQSWLYHAYRLGYSQGYSQGQDDFTREHDWYE